MIGNRAYGDPSQTFAGTLDELRVYQGVLSPDWIAAEYNNQSNPAAFYLVGQ